MLQPAEIVVFLGPSLPLAEAKKIRNATFLPPAEQGDLLGVVNDFKPRVIGLIDGVFLSKPAVWHKEILYALTCGIHVYGASSMGALRAAELSAFGMRGVGEIFKKFASGEFLDDDEVALVHGDADTNYRALTEPMVNVRETLVQARQHGIIDQAQYEALEQLAKQIYFAERTRPAFISAAVEQGIVADGGKLAAFFATNYVDVKRQDAIDLLTVLTRLPDDLAPFVADFELANNRLFETLLLKDASIWEGDTKITRGDVMSYHALHDASFEYSNFSALNRGLALILAEMLGVQVTSDDIADERRRFKLKHRLVKDDVFQQWLRDNHIDEAFFNDLMRQKALCRRMHQWLWLKHGRLGSTGLLMEELILTNRYKDFLRKAAFQQDLIDQYAPFMIDSEHGRDATIQELFQDHFRHEALTLDQHYTKWFKEANFPSHAALELELIRAQLARQSLSRMLQLDDGPARS
ncbi:MAG TPA: TfuA-like protein [Herpetosiphonaceae bacterium]